MVSTSSPPADRRLHSAINLSRVMDDPSQAPRTEQRHYGDGAPNLLLILTKARRVN